MDISPKNDPNETPLEIDEEEFEDDFDEDDFWEDELEKILPDDEDEDD